MTGWIMKVVSRMVVRHAGLIAAGALILTAVLYANIRNLRMGTALTDLFGKNDPQWNTVNEFSQKLGYGNQLFMVIEAAAESDEATEAMEAIADRLIADMTTSGVFKFARCSLKEEELLGMARLFAWNFPYFVQPEQAGDIQRRLDEKQIRETIRKAGAGLVTPFSSLGTNYFVADPLGLMEVAVKEGKGFTEFANFDLQAGSGNRFFSRDHRALLLISEPRLPAVDYQFAEKVVAWTRERVRGFEGEDQFKRLRLRVSLAGAYVYADHDQKFIQSDIRLVSLVSILGNLLLCLLIYPRIPLLLMSLLPTGLGILWTTGVASYYPGEVNLISLSFIAILAGLGDDQIVHFFNRVPQEWAKGYSLEAAMIRTYETTGHSILFCILTMGTATAALASSRFKALSEFGFLLTVGLLMLLLHTIFTVPALMRLWWRISKPRAPETVTFRLFPAVARISIGWVGRHARLLAAVSAAAFLAAVLCLPAVKMNRKIEMVRAGDNPAVAGQKRLSEKFGIEGTPEILLIHGSQEEVLRRAEGLTSALAKFKRQGAVKSIFSPSEIVPSFETQARRAGALGDVDMRRAAAALEKALQVNGFDVAQFRPAIDRLRQLAGGAAPLSVETVTSYLPQGLLDNSIRKVGENRYLAAIAFYGTDPDATEVIPGATVDSWQREYGAFAEFSFNKMNRDLQDQILRDSRRALWLTAAGIAVIVYLCFRSIWRSVLVLMPIVFAIVVTFGLLALVGHRFSFMAITGLPLIVGIGIDNGIHLIRRHLEVDSKGILEIAKSSGAALIQSNLTTVIGFGALMVSRFEPLAEMGLVTAVGVALALVCALWIVPAVILVFERN